MPVEPKRQRVGHQYGILNPSAYQLGVEIDLSQGWDRMKDGWVIGHIYRALINPKNKKTQYVMIIRCYSHIFI